ncbi:MAG: hypothetical protein ACI9R3_001758 [Verrucomicrobiales bacterium]
MKQTEHSDHLSMHRIKPLCSALCVCVLLYASFDSVVAESQLWSGLIDASDKLQTGRYTFKGTNPTGGPGNENYYDGDFADFDGDGSPDRGLGARYGLLRNQGNGWMEPYAGFTGFLFRGMPGAAGWGEDGFQWADVDNDGDYDILQGGNGEPLTLQINQDARFRLKWKKRISALNIVNTDIEGDGDVDLVIAHAFCADRSCGGPRQFSLLVNDGRGNFNSEAPDRGLPFSNQWYGVTGVVSGDVDADGDYDLLVSHGHEKDLKLRHVSVALNDGTGNYRVVPTELPPAGSGFGQGMNLGDIDGDLDLVMCHGPYGEIGQHKSVQHVVAVNDGRGRFVEESAQRFAGSYPGANQQYAGGNGKLVDIDYDGDLDLAAHNVRDGYFQIYQNDGHGIFSFDLEHSMKFVAVTKGLGSDVDITDLNGDGSYDIWLGSGADDVHILLNSHREPSGLRADVPRKLKAVDATDRAVSLQWETPTFVTTKCSAALPLISMMVIGSSSKSSDNVIRTRASSRP